MKYESYSIRIEIASNGYIFSVWPEDWKGDDSACLHASVHEAPTALGRAVEKFFDGHRPPGIRPAMPPQDANAHTFRTSAGAIDVQWRGELPRPTIREALYKTPDAAEVGDY